MGQSVTAYKNNTVDIQSELETKRETGAQATSQLVSLLPQIGWKNDCSDYLGPFEPIKHDNITIHESWEQTVSLYSDQTHCANAVPAKLALASV